MCRQVVQATAPRQFTQYARNQANHVEIGGMHTVFAPNYGSPFVRDLDGGRRYGTIEDFRNFVKLPTCRRTSTTAAERSASRSTCRSTSATSTWSTATSSYSDKPFMGSVTAPERARDTRRDDAASCSAPSTSRPTRSRSR